MTEDALDVARHAEIAANDAKSLAQSTAARIEGVPDSFRRIESHILRIEASQDQLARDNTAQHAEGRKAISDGLLETNIRINKTKDGLTSCINQLNDSMNVKFSKLLWWFIGIMGTAIVLLLRTAKVLV